MTTIKDSGIKYELINDRYGNDMTPATFREMESQFKRVFPDVAIRVSIQNGVPFVFDSLNELVARPTNERSARSTLARMIAAGKLART